MSASGQEQIAGHGQNQNHQADADQHAMVSSIDHLLGGQLGSQHADDQADVEVRQESGKSFFLCKDGRVGDYGAVGDHQEHHVEHEGQSRSVDGIADRELLALYLGILDAAAGHANQGGHRDAEDGHERGFAAQVALHLQAHEGTGGHADGNGKGEAADAFGDLFLGQHVTGQRHGG